MIYANAPTADFDGRHPAPNGDFSEIRRELASALVHWRSRFEALA